MYNAMLLIDLTDQVGETYPTYRDAVTALEAAAGELDYQLTNVSRDATTFVADVVHLSNGTVAGMAIVGRAT